MAAQLHMCEWLFLCSEEGYLLENKRFVRAARKQKAAGGTPSYCPSLPLGSPEGAQSLDRRVLAWDL